VPHRPLPGQLSRRHFLAATAVLGLTAACGSGSSESAGGSPSGSGSEADPDAFPVTVTHALGTTEVPAAPQRVVTVGVTEQDFVLALGVTPIAVTEWYGDQPFATWPWAQDALGDAEPEVLSTADGLQLERIAALAPDLIIGTNAGLTPETWQTLSKIAPTIAHPEGFPDYFAPWDVQTVLIGQALGLASEAEQIVDDIKGRFAQAREEHPEFDGKKAVFLQNAFYDGRAIAYQDGLSTAFLTDLGFTIPPEITPFQQDGGQAYIPLEKLDVLDVADVLVWGTEADQDKTELEKVAVYRELEAVREDRCVFTGGELAGAIYFTSPLSLPYVVDTLVPMLAEVVEPAG
jgi:iron complex transport system substrate-binding protein